MATLTLASIQKVVHQGDRKLVEATLTDTGSYATGGDLPASGTIGALIGLDVELNELDVIYAVNAAGTGLFTGRYNEATGKLQLYGGAAAGAALGELAAAAIPGGPATIRVRAVGKGSVTPQ